MTGTPPGQLRLGSFCTGYGGLDAAVENHFGAKLVWYSEIEKAANTLLETRFPDVPNLGDLTEINWDETPPVDILCAGYPCQPFSIAGSRKGEQDERAIFGYIADSISALRPRYVLLENVAGHLTLGGAGVVASLTEMGYDSRWGIIRAADAGAPHQRKRWFCLATNTDVQRPGQREIDRGIRRVGERSEISGRPASSSREEPRHRSQTVTDTPVGDGGVTQQQPVCAATQQTSEPREHVGEDTTTDTPVVSEQHESSENQGKPSQQSGGDTRRGAVTDPNLDALAIPVGATGRPLPVAERRDQPRPVTDTSGEGSQGHRGEHGLRETSEEVETNWGDYDIAIQQWGQILGRPAPNPADGKGVNPVFVEWMMGLPEGWVTGLGLARTAELKMLGNGVVPQQAALALTVLAPEWV